MVKKYTVAVTKKDGMKSQYHVLSTSAGGAETVALKEVYNAQYALATEGWPSGVKSADLISKGVSDIAVKEFLSKNFQNGRIKAMNAIEEKMTNGNDYEQRGFKRGDKVKFKTTGEILTIDWFPTPNKAYVKENDFAYALSYLEKI